MVSPRTTRPLVPIFEPRLPEVRIGEIRVLSLVMKYFGAGDVDIVFISCPPRVLAAHAEVMRYISFSLLIIHVGIGKDF